ncbi:RND transporter [Alkalitalea saponilacus]|nr:RND transporter [Alkalitalea saponilacus]
MGKYRLLFVPAIFILAVLAVSQFPRLNVNPGFDDYIPGEVGNRAYMNVLDSIFGGNEKLMLILTGEDVILNQQTFERIYRLTNGLLAIEGVENATSIKNVFTLAMVDGFTTQIPIIDEEQIEKNELGALKSAIENSEAAQRFVSSDFTSTAIIVTKSLGTDDDALVADMISVIENNPGREAVYIGGLPYLRTSIKTYINRDLKLLLPTALVLMVLMLYFFFREWKGVLLPFSVVVLSIIFSFGFMAVMDWEISLVSVLLPIMLIAIANDYGIHLINLYQEKCRTGNFNSMGAIAMEIYRELRKPILITALTTIGGMLGLLTHKMAPAAQLGVLASLGILLAFLMSIFLIPVLLSFYGKRRIVQRKTKKEKETFINLILPLFVRWVLHHPRRVVVCFIIIAIVSTFGIFFIKIDTNIEGYFLGKSDISKSVELVNEKFGGSQYVSVLFSGDVLSPDALQNMEHFALVATEIPEVGHVLSPSAFFRELSQGLYEPDEAGYGELPQSKAEAVQYLEVAFMLGFQGEVSQLVDFDYSNARMLVSMTDGSNQTGKKVLDALHQITLNDPRLVAIAGPGLSKIQMADMVIHGQIASLALALVIILILLSVIFKSPAAGFKGILPLLLSVLFLFGVMGYLGIALDIVTALLSSIMIGVGIDYTIHFLWRYKSEYAKLADNSQAIENSLMTAGRGIIYNAFSVMVGFSVLMLSGFAPLRFFGVLVTVSIFACLMSALLLIPALITLTKPTFLQKQSELK